MCSADDSVGDVEGSPVGGDIAQAHDEVGVDGVGGGPDRCGDAADDGEVGLEGSLVKVAVSA